MRRSDIPFMLKCWGAILAVCLGGCAGLDAAYVRADADRWNSIGAEHEAFVTRAVAGQSPDAPFVTPSGFKTTAGQFYKARAAWSWTWHRVLVRAHRDLKWDVAGLRAPSLREEGIPVIAPPPVPHPPIPDAPEGR